MNLGEERSYNMKKKNFIKCFTTLLITTIVFCYDASAQLFTDVSLSSGIDCIDKGNLNGLAILDFNDDGWEDIFFIGGVYDDFLYKNNGDGTFSDVTIAAGLSLTRTVSTLGAAAGDINNDGYRDLFITTGFYFGDSVKWQPNILYLNNGDGTFSDISVSSGIGLDSIFSGPATFGDINNDGYLDLFVSSLVDERELYGFGQIPGSSAWTSFPDRMYLNNGDNTFTDVAEELGIVDSGMSLTCAFFDYNNDANIDLYLGNDVAGTTYSQPNKLLKNNYPDFSFTDVGAETGTNEPNTSMGLAIGDYDENGWLDFYITYCGKNALYKNNGGEFFTDESKLAGCTDDDVPIVDSLNDYVTYLYDYAPDPGFAGIDSAFWQYCDTVDCYNLLLIITVVDSTFFPWTLFTIDAPYAYLLVQKDMSIRICMRQHESEILSFYGVTETSHGTQNLTRDSEILPTTGWGTNFFDADNDSDLDIFVANGYEDFFGVRADNNNTLFTNNGNETFTNASEGSGVNSPWSARGSVHFDYDNDGDMDLAVNYSPYKEGFGMYQDPHSALYRNNLEQTVFTNWLKVKLEGVESNRDGIGAMIRVYTGFKMFMQQIDGGSSAMSHNSIIAHFGLGPYNSVDSLEITWPGGCKQMIYNVGVNQLNEITQDCSGIPVSTFNHSNSKALVKAYPVPSNSYVNFDVKINETDQIQLTIYDIAGKEKVKLFQGFQTRDDLQTYVLKSQELEPGIYTYNLKTSTGSYSGKIVITR